MIRRGRNADERSEWRLRRERAEPRERVTGQLAIVVSKFTAKFKALRASAARSNAHARRDGVPSIDIHGKLEFQCRFFRFLS